MTKAEQALATAIKLRDEIHDFGYWRSLENLHFLIESLERDVKEQAE